MTGARLQVFKPLEIEPRLAHHREEIAAEWLAAHAESDDLERKMAENRIRIRKANAALLDATRKQIGRAHV